MERVCNAPDPFFAVILEQPALHGIHDHLSHDAVVVYIQPVIPVECNGRVRANYPECQLVGPCGNAETSEEAKAKTGGIAKLFSLATAEDLLNGTKEPLDIYSYHAYNGISERLAPMLPHMHWDPEKVTSEEYLNSQIDSAVRTIPTKEKYCPGGEIWVTESGDAGAGGNTWASTYLDVLRTLNELGGFAR